VITMLKKIFPTALILGLSLALGCSSGGETFRPNILLIVMDAVRADHLSCYGYDRPTTPNIDRVAERGLRFSRAVSSSSWTLPSHASLFTGLLPFEHGTHTQHNWLLDRFPTLAELLKLRGYVTAGFSNNPHVDQAQNMTQGFDIFEAVWADTTAVTARKPHNSEQTNKLVRRFLRQQRAKPGKDPFFIFINYMDVHTPTDPPEPYRTNFLDPHRPPGPLADSATYNPDLVREVKLTLSENDYATLRDLYDGSLNYLDAKIGELLEELKNLGLYDSTLVIITSDHGELFGEHDYYTHGVLLFWKLLHIPLIIHHPQLVPEPAVQDKPVAITDIFHTLTRLAGVAGSSAATEAPIRNLFDPQAGDNPCYSEVRTPRAGGGPLARRYNTRSVLTPEGRHFILTEGEAWECYDLNTDPGEMHNLCPSGVTKTEVSAAVTGFESKLVPFAESLEDLRSSRATSIDPQQEQAMRALGYVGGGSAGRSSENLSWHGREHFNTGVFHMGRREYEDARKEFNRTLIIDQAYRPAHVALGQLLFRERQYSEALRHFLKISSRFPGDPEIQRLTAVLYALNGEPKEAERLFLRLVELYPKMAPSFFNQQGNLFLRRREPETSLILFDLLRQRFPQVAAYEKGYREALRLKNQTGGSK